MLLQRLRTRDPDELAEGFRRWQLRFRQLGCGSFRGVLPHPFNLPAAGDGPSQSCRNPVMATTAGRGMALPPSGQ